MSQNEWTSKRVLRYGSTVGCPCLNEHAIKPLRGGKYRKGRKQIRCTPQNKRTIIMSCNDSSSNASSFIEGSTTNSERCSTDGFSTTSSNLSKEQQEELAAKETRDVRRSRALFFGLLALSAAIGGSVTYLFSSRGEMNDFETEVSISSRQQY
jgi:hypothetical protein